MAKSKHARSIGAFRSSGLNPRPVPRDPWDAPQGHTVALGSPRDSQRARERADAATGVHLADPPRVPADSAVVAVHLEGKRVRVPADWGVALSSAKGRAALHLLEPGGVLHVLVIDADGQLRELAGMSGDLVSDLRRQHFGGA